MAFPLVGAEAFDIGRARLTQGERLKGAI